MSQLTKQQLKGENQTQFPNNNIGAITPSNLRAFNVDMIDSTVNQTDFTNFSGSVAGQFASITSSLPPGVVSGSSQVNIYDLENFANYNDSVIFDIGQKLFTSSFEAYTQSVDTELNGLESSASLALTTASFAAGTLTFTKGNGTTFGVVIPDVSGSTIDTGSFATTASFNQYTQSNDQRVGSLEAATASFVTETESGSFLITASFSGNTLTFTKGDNTTFGLLIPDVSGSTIDTGSFATTGSNNFRGVETIGDIPGTGFGEVYLLGRSGSLVLGNSVSTPTYAALSHLSSSQINANTNLIFKTNNNTADTILSGSQNIFTNPGAPTAGFKRYLTAANMSLMGVLPQISGSMQFSPTISGNIMTATSATSNPLTIRGPVSSSAYSISSNVFVGGILNLGSSAANNFQQAVNGANISNNIIGGPTSLVAFRTRLTQQISITGNQLQGANTLNMNSSSIDLNANLFYGTNTINNNSTGSSRVSALGNAAGIYQTLFFGSNTATFSGSNDPNDLQDLDYNGGIYRSIIVGTNTPFVITGPTGSNSINNTGIIGNGLIVTGSSGNQSFASDTLRHGSLFAGRWNADGTRNRTAENIFAIGTGTSNTARKTGFLIDSGSNTFIEGTLNVSGSSTLSGSLYIQNTSALPSQTGSGVLTYNSTTGQIGQTSYRSLVSASLSAAQFYSTISQSGSANVSQSVSFNGSGSVYGISLGSGTQLTVANEGTYNIQFSAQLLADTGADNVYIWFKKNGTNIADSATELAIENNDEALMTVNILVDAAANDYYEVAWESTQGDAILYTQAASGNRPAVPSIITTITQVR